MWIRTEPLSKELCAIVGRTDIVYREIVILELQVREYRARCSCCKIFRAQVEGVEPRAVADLQEALAINPESHVAHNNLAWIYVKGPAELRDPEKALPLAQRAVRLAPERGALHNNLGLAHYRLKQWDAAMIGLNRAVQVNQGQAPSSCCSWP